MRIRKPGHNRADSSASLPGNCHPVEARPLLNASLAGSHPLVPAVEARPLSHLPFAALAAELDMLHRALERTRAAKDVDAEAAALRCIATVEAELDTRDEEEC